MLDVSDIQIGVPWCVTPFHTLGIDKIQTIKELLCVKYGLLSLPSLDVSQIDFMLESLCTF